MAEAEKMKNILYEDEKIVAAVPEKPFVKGHIIVQAKGGKKTIKEMDEKDFGHLAYGASFAATALFENLQAHGTNIIMNTGSQIGENETNVKVDVLARWAEDGVKVLWEPKKIPDDEMTEIASKIKDKIPVEGVSTEKKVVDLDEKKVEKIEEKISEEDPTTKKDEEKRVEEPEKKENKRKTEEKKEKDDVKTNSESYLVKQLKRMP